jgi:hypothetical protein
MEIEFEALHLLALALVAVVILITDHDGFLYLRGKKAVLNAVRVKRLHQLVWVGLVAMIVTGIGLVAEDPDVLEEEAFPVKMLMVLALVINGFLIGRLSAVSTTTPFVELPRRQKQVLLGSGAVSVACWIGATVIGFNFL